MFSTIKMAIAIMLITGIAGAGMYVMKLRADNATLKSNQLKLETAIEDQTKLLEQQKEDFKAIMESNKKLNVLINTFKKDMFLLLVRRAFPTITSAADSIGGEVMNSSTLLGLRVVIHIVDSAKVFPIPQACQTGCIVQPVAITRQRLPYRSSCILLTVFHVSHVFHVWNSFY